MDQPKRCGNKDIRNPRTWKAHENLRNTFMIFNNFLLGIFIKWCNDFLKKY